MIFDAPVAIFKSPQWVKSTDTAHIFKALYQPTLTKVALKVAHAYVREQPLSMAMWRHECEILKQLKHPHLVNLIYEESTPTHALLATQWCEGPTMRALLEASRQCQTPLPVRQGCYLWLQLLEALHALHHTHGWVHGDLTPDNILIETVGNEPRLVLIDFALSQPIGLRPLNFEAFGICGTWAYLSPEQVLGEVLTAGSDLFSLGALIYEWLFARKLFDAQEAPRTIHQIVEAPPLDSHQALIAFRPDVPPQVMQPLLTLIERLTERDVDQRLNQIDEVKRVIQAVLLHC